MLTESTNPTSITIPTDEARVTHLLVKRPISGEWLYDAERPELPTSFSVRDFFASKQDAERELANRNAALVEQEWGEYLDECRAERLAHPVALEQWHADSVAAVGRGERPDEAPETPAEPLDRDHWERHQMNTGYPDRWTLFPIAITD